MANMTQFFPCAGWRAGYLVDDSDSLGTEIVIGWGRFEGGLDGVFAVVADEQGELIPAFQHRAEWIETDQDDNPIFLGLIPPNGDHTHLQELAQIRRKDLQDEHDRETANQIIAEMLVSHDLTISLSEARSFIYSFGHHNSIVSEFPKEVIEGWLRMLRWKFRAKG